MDDALLRCWAGRAACGICPCCRALDQGAGEGGTWFTGRRTWWMAELLAGLEAARANRADFASLAV